MKTPKHTPVTSINPEFSRKPLAYLVSSLALVSCLSGVQAVAQEATSTSTAQPNQEPLVEVIEVTGTRASQESAINRKKKAKTAVDSIIAEDVGSLPDSNVGEAISRIAGIALDRGDTGEGVGVTVRGSTADLTRVEIDGQGVQSGGGAASAMNGSLSDGASGRSQGMKDLPSDLIQSVDVVKGSTADMTEGSLGGGVIVKTRSSLDMKKGYKSIRISGSQGSINTDISPTLNVVLADKFFDDRFGVLVNASSSKLTNEGHNIQNTANSAGYTHDIDFDNSPEKTFSFNPNTLSTTDTAANTSILTPVALTAGGTWSSETPASFLSKAAAATTKAECMTAFPAMTTAQINSISGTTNRNNAINQRNNELKSCLNQWNDWTPTLIRYGVKRDYEDRNNIDVRFDLKVNDDLSVYTKLSRSTRDILNTTQTYNLGGILSVNPTVVSLPGVYNGSSFVDTAGVRSAIPASGYYTINNNTSYISNNAARVTNAAININPSSVVVDENHHVTQYTYSNGNANTDQIDSDQYAESKYLQIGGTYKKDNLLAEFMFGDAQSEFSRKDIRTAWNTNYGTGTLSVMPNGLWTYSLPASSTFDQTNAAVYAQINPNLQAAKAAVAATAFRPATPAYTAAQQPLISNIITLNATQNRLNETEEKTGKLDVTYEFEDQIPFLSSVKGGLNWRENSIEGWTGPGATIEQGVGVMGAANYVAPVVIPIGGQTRVNVYACQDTAGSLGAGGAPCAFGYTPSKDLTTARYGDKVVSSAELQEMIAKSMKAPSASFMNSLPNSSGIINSWYQLDVKKFRDLVGAPNFDLDCMKECVGNDGKVYKQPFYSAVESVLAGYVMADFEFKDLPLGMEATSNMGVRVVENEVTGSGNQTLISRRIVPGVFDPANPNLAAGFVDYSVTRQVDVSRETRDVLPSFNFALWTLPDELVVRYSHGKTVARPGAFQLLPQGTCTYDERNLGNTETDDDGSSSSTDMRCTGNFGNPALEAYTNINQNLSLEWYPSKGYMFSAAVFRQKAKIGGPRIYSVGDYKPYEGSDVVDPQTGTSLADVEYTVNMWKNGPGVDRKGVEFAGKAAFTFLPWKFKYLGVDFNSSILESSDSVPTRDLNSGDALPPVGESAYAYNFALWYDDGHFTARVAYQARGESFSQLTGVSGNVLFNYPADGVTTSRFPYNPAGPIFKDATSFIDAKIAYKFDSGVDIYLEGRNLGLESTSTSSGGYYDFADGTPSINDMNYFGRKIVAGVNYKF